MAGAASTLTLYLFMTPSRRKFGAKNPSTKQAKNTMQQKPMSVEPMILYRQIASNGVSENRGTPKWMVYNGLNLMKMG